MSQYEFYTLTGGKDSKDWPQWVVIADCGSSYYFKKSEALAQLAQCKTLGVKAEIAKLLFE